MMRTAFLAIVLFTGFIAVPALAQGTVSLGVSGGLKDKEDAVPPPGGVVTGRVLFADTNGPARFAKVLLKSVSPASGGDDLTSMMNALGNAKSKTKLTPEEETQQQQAKAASASMMAALSDLLVSTTVAVDGTYTFTNVKAGTYYVHAMAAGYIDPMAQFAADELTSSDPAVRTKIAAAVPSITVSGTEQVRADLRLQRGAAISGRVLYDDGTPAVG
jgi:hypothetical protein